MTTPQPPPPPSRPVPDAYAVVRGGIGPLPPPGTTFSGAAGVDKEDAGRGIPHNQMRASTAAFIRAHGGEVKFVPELTRSGQWNERHVDIIEGRSGAFGESEPNPVPKPERVR